ncbi:cAMP-regulated phosphoprotein 21 isoform X3 [Monodelphis domestica]|uniref:cAMP-regulated phosphoprotein 21 isoform X3 n=1 Tax=Monodelphis domestica TaxID=13616 RepID=UPI0024E259A8|nr:cAMP-regulated phosphoprotein 21 isoform X3 [Monodelphis domestica]XP_056659983.1 cAMP-regulated phosphoprotein 21 isoform X3 [Monodelphis domestica]XP_056659986.1 cAMP-regulated phosphoprotein 21 isoform X3 [Monodelphis domestica]
MSEQGETTAQSAEAPGAEQEARTPENGIIQSDSLDEEEKLELQRRLAAQNQERRKSKSGAGKGKLTRSLAVCEESSGRPGAEGLQDQESVQLQLSRLPSLQEDDKASKDGSEREREKEKAKEREKTGEKAKNRMLSKDCSQEYTDSTGIDLHEFLVTTLKNNPRDRMILLKMEQEIMDFISDDKNHYKKFPQMSSYQRMLVHRVAAYFGMDHNVDQTGKSVIINKTGSTRIPEQRFCEHVKDDKGEEGQKRFILKRDNSSIDKEDNQQNRIHPFRDDRRRKSVEEREEEYQRVRERIFARASVCSQESLLVETRGKAPGSRQSSTDTELRWPECQRPWSSTDSDSSSRSLRPAITKTASFGGITVLSRADSAASSRSAGKLSKAGSESSSSAGSSGSLSRAHQPLQSSPLISGASGPSSGSGTYSENGQSGQTAPGNPSYILLPLEATGIPPGSILLNPHTGQPFVNPDGTPAIYNPPSGQQSVRSPMGGQAPPQPSSQAPPQQMAGHLVTQPLQALQASPQSGTYPSVSYPPQHLLPVSAVQPFPVRDDVAAQFSQISLSRQSSGDTAEPPAGPVYPPQQPGYVLASAGPQLPPGGFSGSGPALPQQVVQPSPGPPGFAQPASPAQQMPVYYYPPGQFPTSASQQYRPVGSVQFGAQRSAQMPQPPPPPAAQQAGYQPVLSNQQQGFQGLMGMSQPPQSQNLMSSPQGSQVQGMMVPYPAMSSYQVSMPQGSPGVTQQSYQQPLVLPSQAGPGNLPGPGVPVYCNVIPPAAQGNLRLLTPPCPSQSVPVLSASCRTTCASAHNPAWPVKY